MDYKAWVEKAADFFSVHSGSGHFWYQRVTAVALVPLSIWLLVLLHKALNAPYADTVAWLSSPFNTLAIIAWTVAVVYHAALGVQVVIEDYVSTIPVRHLAIRATNLTFLVLGIAALLAIVIILLAR
ncbi:succinate dehydrogenase, hydrophobic membrane anchor protein [Methylomonas koyamae]|uniref:Succinate dehydrogenase hydrophobic membrane anchor subunit n=1 Tax=Methylomonas koyamae TaxID=702114 RepID=A0A291IIU8_9GAMM|nr:succinate dehydrogenase, hydrophobic membrane anchor protein [Methylomonas koyamae]ATG90214.1 succinate dehydrogenase hydrophobic membrane anchor protein [Methylomonas koyamae]OAI25370.1 succinate dehydrogenase [Methylomonas koyamae]WNB77798.1 succinate dehydrogenase, hydrophobic membrane anchor protein [Methylomonas koyamae]